MLGFVSQALALALLSADGTDEATATVQASELCFFHAHSDWEVEMCLRAKVGSSDFASLPESRVSLSGARKIRTESHRDRGPRSSRGLSAKTWTCPGSLRRVELLVRFGCTTTCTGPATPSQRRQCSALPEHQGGSCEHLYLHQLLLSGVKSEVHVVSYTGYTIRF